MVHSHPSKDLLEFSKMRNFLIFTNHEQEFENEEFETFCDKFGIKHYFSAPITPQQKGVVKKKNRSLEELVRTLLNETNLPKYFWVDAIKTAFYVSNRVLIRLLLKKITYELFKGRKPNISHFKIFCCKCFVLNNGKDNLDKFDKSNKGIFLCYSSTTGKKLLRDQFLATN